MGLSYSEKEELELKGFVVLKGVFSTDEINRLLGCFEELESWAAEMNETQDRAGSYFVFDQSTEGAKLNRVVWAAGSQPEISKVGQDPRLLSIASEVLGSDEMEQIISQCHFKFPGDNVFYPYHQDSQNRRYGTKSFEDLNGKGSYVQTALVLDPMTNENGPLLFLPESHRSGHLELNRPEIYQRHVETEKFVPVLASPGDLVVFGPFVIHGSEPNLSDFPRRILINGYAYPGANRRRYPGQGSCRKLVYLPD